MNRSDPAAKPYAQALLEIGQKHGNLGEILDDFLAFNQAVESDRKMREFFLSPMIDAGKKAGVMRRALEGKVCGPVLGLVLALVRRRREPLFDNVYDQFQTYKDASERRVRVQVISAREVSEHEKGRLSAAIGARAGKEVVIETRVDPSILGGVILRVGDKRVDGSVRARLNRLRRRLRNPELAANLG